MTCPECNRFPLRFSDKDDRTATCVGCCAKFNLKFELIEHSLVIKLPDSKAIERARKFAAPVPKDKPTYFRFE